MLKTVASNLSISKKDLVNLVLCEIWPFSKGGGGRERVLERKSPAIAPSRTSPVRKVGEHVRILVALRGN